MIAPPILLLSTVMPVLVGAKDPAPLMLPVLLTFPPTVEFTIWMQVMLPELLTEPTDAPLKKYGLPVEQEDARAGGAPAPTSSAATELDAKSARRFAALTRIEPPPSATASQPPKIAREAVLSCSNSDLSTGWVTGNAEEAVLRRFIEVKRQIARKCGRTATIQAACRSCAGEPY